MPAIVKILGDQGLESVAYQADSLADAARYESLDSVYTVSNTYNGTQTLLLEAHLERLEDSAAREGIALRYERARLRAALRQLILASGYGDVRFRISVPAAATHFLLSIEPFQAPAPELIAQGTRCITSSQLKRRNPAAKTSDWMRQRLQAATPAGIYETFLVDSQGRLLEGLTSNFFAVIAGELRSAGDGVLAGIARQVVFEVCRGQLPLSLEAPTLAELPHFSEAFLSSSSRGLIPVVEIDGQPIGAGGVGQRTLALRAAYQRWVAAHLEEL